jgi:hypothetical protein
MLFNLLLASFRSDLLVWFSLERMMVFGHVLHGVWFSGFYIVRRLASYHDFPCLLHGVLITDFSVLLRVNSTSI